MATAGPMKSVTTWKQGAVFEHVSSSAALYVTDAVLPGEAEHERAGPTPMELLLGSVGGCSGVDLVDMLRKMRLSLVSLRIEIRGERREEYPRVFRRVHLVYEIETDPVDVRRVRRAVDLSTTKYCAATATVACTAETTYTLHYDGEEYHGTIEGAVTDRSGHGEASRS